MTRWLEQNKTKTPAGAVDSILGQEDSLQKEMATYFQYSCLENSMEFF